MPKASANPWPATVSAAQLGHLLGLSPRRLRELAELGVLPRTPRGRYPIEAVAAYASHLREVAAGRAAEVRDGNGGEVLDLATERARLAKAQREAVELRMARDRGDLVDAAAVKIGFANQVTAARNRLLGVPSEAKQRMPHLAIDEIEELEQLIAGALAEVADGTATDPAAVAAA